MLKKIKEECYVVMGQSPSSTYYNQIENGTPFMQGRKTFGDKYPTLDTWTTKLTKLATKGSVLMSVRAPVGDVNIAPCDLCIGRGLASIKMKNGNNQYLYYLLRNNSKLLRNKSTGTIFESINKVDLENLILDFHSDCDQNKISMILSNIDKKIILNNKINSNLYDIGKSIYNEKIVNNGIDRKLGTFFEVITGKKDANTSNEKGKYPFFTCSKQISRIDDYSYDGSAILLAGNGDFNVKVYKGKFDAYQRTYVLMPYDEKYFGYLYFAINENLIDLTSSFRGSVIKFITKGMIENYKIPFIENDAIYKQLNTLIEKIRQNESENEKLSQLRDTLLPRLMNGEIDLHNMEI